MATENDFAIALEATFEATGKQLTDNVLRLWLSLMPQAGVSWSDAVQALNAHLLDPQSGQFAPKPADIIKQIHGTSKDKRDGLEGRAGVEWGRVIASAEKYGAYRSVVFDDPRTMVAVQALGGWQAVCNNDRENHTWMQAAFRRAYCAENVRVPNVLPGIHHGKPGETVAMIGDREKCEHILASGGGQSILGSPKGIKQLKRLTDAITTRR